MCPWKQARSQNQSHMKGEMLKYAVELYRHDMYVCVLGGGVGLCALCSDFVEPEQAPWLRMFACLTGLFWLPRALYALSLHFTFLQSCSTVHSSKFSSEDVTLCMFC